MCPIHKLVNKQTFSVAEIEFYVRHKEALKICDSCGYWLEKRIGVEVAAAAVGQYPGIGISNPVPPGKQQRTQRAASIVPTAKRRKR